MTAVGPELGAEAVRMVGISGDPDALAGLDALSSAGGDEVNQTLMASGKPAKLLAVAD